MEENDHIIKKLRSVDMFCKKDALRIIEQIKSRSKNSQEYHLVLTDLILKQKLEYDQEHYLDTEKWALLRTLFKEYSQSFREFLFKQLHDSWYQVYKTPPSKPRSYSFEQVDNIPAILVWGYDLRIQRVKVANFYPINLCRYSHLAVKALWESIKISGITTLKGLDFDKQSFEHWMICFDALQNASLTSLNVYGSQGEFPVDIWKLFWETIQKSSIKHLNFCFSNFHECKESIWQVFFDGLGKCNLSSLSLEKMQLSTLSTEQLKKLCTAIGLSMVNSLDLTCNFLNDSNPESWKVICNIIKSPNITHLRLLELNPSGITDESWVLLSDAIGQGNLISLEFSVDAYITSITDSRWETLINALKRLRLQSLVLAMHSAKSITFDVLLKLCELLNQGTIRTFTLNPSTGSLFFTFDQWQLLGQTLKNNGINKLNVGSIGIHEYDMHQFIRGLQGQEIQYIHLQNSKLGEMELAEWEALAGFIKSEGIRSLDLTKGNSLDSNLASPLVWEYFCTFIVNSDIREIAFYLSTSNWFSPDKISRLSEVIQQSQLEYFNFDALDSGIDKITDESFATLCNAIGNSKITQFIHPFYTTTLTQTKYEVLVKALKMVERRALFNKSLGALCAQSMINANARLKENCIEYEIQNTIHRSELTEIQYEMLVKYDVF